MASVKVTLAFLAFACLSAVQGNVPKCLTPEKYDGICVPMRKCRAQRSIERFASASPENAEHLLQSVCIYGANERGYCCPVDTLLDLDLGGPAPDTRGPNNPVAVTPSYYKLPVAPDCGQPLEDLYVNKMVGGFPATPGQFPWMVALGYRDEYGNIDYKCGGVLITKIHVLTAAHCVFGLEHNLTLARAGVINKYWAQDMETVQIVEYHMHEEYNNYTQENDIAVLRLREEMTSHTVAQICLPLSDEMRSNSFKGYYPFLAGWGTEKFDKKNAEGTDEMMAVQIPVWDNADCKRTYADVKKAVINKNVICAGLETGGRDSCSGDSGGPMMVPYFDEDGPDDQTDTFYAIGVVSYARGCALAQYPGINTRVTEYIEWIKYKLN